MGARAAVEAKAEEKVVAATGQVELVIHQVEEEETTRPQRSRPDKSTQLNIVVRLWIRESALWECIMPKAKVQRVIDGDTFITNSGKKVRLANVNAPEKGRRGAPQARKDLRGMISRKEVNVDVVAHDPYGRAVANVKVGNKSVNKSMRNKGWK